MQNFIGEWLHGHAELIRLLPKAMGAGVPKTAPALCLVLTLAFLAELIRLIVFIENYRGRNVWLVF